MRARWHFRHAEHLGSRVRIYGRPALNIRGTLRVGDRTRIVSAVATVQIDVEPNATMEIGELVFINYGCSLGATQLIRIGPRCSLGSHVMMIDNDFHSLEPERRNVRPPSAPIILEENVWIGARAIVMRGVTIGAHSVIGAGSIVTQDIPPRSLAVGVPARVVRSI